MKNVTIQDIAKELNLSRNTVSKALSNSEIVSQDTRQLIIKKAKELGYRKLNPELDTETNENSALEMKSIIILAHREIADFWNRIILGISEELNKENMNLLLNFINEEEEENLILPANINNKQVLGIILLSVFKLEYINKVIETNIPIVCLDMPIVEAEEELKSDIVIVEGHNSVYKMTKSLIDGGKNILSFIGDITYCKSVLDRWYGFRKALESSNIPLKEEICIINHMPKRYYDENEIYCKLNSIKEMPDAFVCCNDDVAINVIKYLKEKGYKVPEDIAVTGFDNKKDAIVIEPKLSTVHVYNEHIGKKLVQQLLWRMDNPEMPYEVITIKTEVIYRESSCIRNK